MHRLNSVLAGAHLVVDDQPDQLGLLIDGLRSAGCRITAGLDGSEPPAYFSPPETSVSPLPIVFQRPTSARLSATSLRLLVGARRVLRGIHTWRNCSCSCSS